MERSVAGAFVGRALELEALATACRGSRLVTVFGMAGVGKTRLLTEHVVAQGLSPAPVDLTTARTRSEVVARIDARPRGTTLLILDACEGAVEHVAAHVLEILSSSPRVRCIATSRRPLGVAAERLLRVEPLSLPGGAGDVNDAPSSALFLERARSEIGELTLDELTAEAVCLIAHSTGGLPLAIELCARRLRALGVVELARELVRSLAVIGGGHRDAPPRHQSLDAALAPSWERLAPWERSALAQASVFHGGFTRVAAEHVLDVSTFEGAPACVDVLQALVDHSLIARAPGATGAATLFRVHEIVRHHARSAMPDVAERARGRHRRYFLDRATTSDGPDLVASVRDALALAGGGEVDAHLLEGAVAADGALQASRSSWALVHDDSGVARRLELLDAALAKASPTAAPRVLTHALVARADALSEVGRAAEASADRRRAEDLAARPPDACASLSRSLGAAALDEGRVDAAMELLADACAVYAALGDRAGEASVRVLLARAWRLAGDLALAKEEAARAESMAGGASAPRVALHARLELGCVAHARGDLARAEHCFQQTSPRDTPAALDLLRVESASTGAAGTFDGVRRELERSRHAHHAAGATALEAEVLGLAGLVEELDGRRAVARVRYDEAGAMLRDAGRAVLLGQILAAVGRLEAMSDGAAAAREALDEARAVVFATGVRSLVDLYDVSEAHVAVAVARAARRRGADADVRVSLDRARAVLTERAAPDPHVRIARRLLARDIAGLERQSPADEPKIASPTLVVSSSARWFCAPGATRVALDTRRSLRLLLQSLADRREQRPGTPLDVATLLDAGWPGERVLHAAGTSRVYTAIAQLRRAGLHDVLVRRDDGYLLDPAVPLVRQKD